MSAQNGHFLEFGPFRLDAEERVLWRDGQPVPVTGKAFETLLVLVEHRGHIVGKEELLRELAHSFVEEGNLFSTLVSEARRRSRAPPAVHETVARRVSLLGVCGTMKRPQFQMMARQHPSMYVEKRRNEKASTAGAERGWRSVLR